jgi:hypothetical protein
MARLLLILFFFHFLFSAKITKSYERDDSSSTSEYCTPLKSFYATKAIQEHVFDYLKKEFQIRFPDEVMWSARNDEDEECELLPWKDLFYEHNSLRDPLDIVHNRRSFRCKKCSKQFKTKEYLDRHIELKHVPTKTHKGVCSARFCTFIPCDGVAKRPTITNLPEHHPERDRAAYLCRETFAKCFPPKKSLKFKSAYSALESYFCDGGGRQYHHSNGGGNSGNAQQKHFAGRRHSPSGGTNGGGVALQTVLTWIMISMVVGYYLFHFILKLSQPKHLSKIQRNTLFFGQNKRPSTTTTTVNTIGVGAQGVQVQTPQKRKQVSSSSTTGISPTTHVFLTTGSTKSSLAATNEV